MKVFVVGATGYLGSRIAKHLIGHGHEVLGFARSEASAEKVVAYGGVPIIGDIEDLGTLTQLANSAGATVFAPQIPTQDQEYDTVAALLKSYAGTQKAFIFTSGTGVLGQRTDGEWSEDSFAEDDEFVPSKYLLRRCETERMTRAAAAEGVKAMVIRPPLIWGDGFHGFVDQMLKSIEKTGKACYIGRGLNLYTHVNVTDLAELYRLAMEKGQPGALYHAVAGELNNRTLAEYVARQQGVEAQRVTPSEAVDIWGKFAMLIVLGVSSRSRSPRSRKELGWVPKDVDPVDQILAGQLNGRR